MTDAENILIKPRACGGWIAVFDDGSLRFGITAESEAEARQRLQASLIRWREAPKEAVPADQ
jgi:hypothetical protein